MSITDRTRAVLIGTNPAMAGTPTPVDEEAKLTDEGWDSLHITYALRSANPTPEQIAAMFPIGGKLGERNWWVTGVLPQRKSPGFWLIEVDLKGWASTKPAKIQVGASAESQTAENILAPQTPTDTVGALFAKVQTHENQPTLTVTYLVANYLDVATEKTSKVGTAQTPPVTIAVPDSVWTFLTEFVWHWPQGWVLMASEPEPLVGCSAALVTDSYKYIRDKTPG